MASEGGLTKAEGDPLVRATCDQRVTNRRITGMSLTSRETISSLFR